MCMINVADRWAVAPSTANYVLGADDAGKVAFTPNRPEQGNGTISMYEQGSRAASSDFTILASGAGANLTSSIVSGKYIGAGKHSTGTTTTGRSFSALASGAVAIQFDSISGTWTYETLLEVDTLDDGTNTFNACAGFIDTVTTVDQVDGVYVAYKKAANGTAFQFVTSANSTRTTTGSGVTVTAGSWVKIKITVTNDASASCWIVADGTAYGSTPTVTQSTNIPSGASRVTGAGNGIIKTASTTARTLTYAYQRAKREPINAATTATLCYFEGDLSNGDALGLPTGYAGQVVQISEAGHPEWEERSTPLDAIPYCVTDVANGVAFVTGGSGGSVAAATAVSGMPPQQTLSTGATTSGSAARLGSQDAGGTVVFDANSATIVCDVIFTIPTLSVTGQTFEVWIGGGGDSNVEPNDGFGFAVASDIDAHLLCETDAGGSQTETVSTLTIVAGTTYFGRIEITANSQVKFFAAALGSAFTLLATHTTNIPTGTAHEMTPNYHITKTAGTTARTVTVSHFQVWQRLTNTGGAQPQMGDGPGLVRTGGGAGTRGDVGIQVDDGSTASPAPAYADAVPTMRTMWWIKETPGTANGPYTSAVSGTGAVAPVAAIDGAHSCVKTLTTGTTTTGRAARSYAPGYCFDTGGHVFRSDFKFRIATISGATDTFNLSGGHHDALTAIDAVDGAYIKIDSNSNTAIQCVVSSNSTRTTTSSAVTLVAGTWYRIVIIVVNVTRVDFYVVAEGSAWPAAPTVTITTNIPTAAARATATGCGILKSAGTTSRTADVAYQELDHDRLAA